MRIDFEVSGGGTVYLFKPLTPAARAWVEDPPTGRRHLVLRRGRRRAPLHRADHRRRDRRRARGAVMRRYVERPRPEPASEEFLALLILLGPLAYVVRWIWRKLITFRCELGRGQPVFVQAASRESCPNARLFVDGEASDAGW